MAVTTSEIVRRTELKAPFSMIEGKGLWARLVEQISQAVAELQRDPRAFLYNLFFDDDKDLQRSKRIRVGFALGLIPQVILIGLVTLLGHSTTVVTQAESDQGDLEDIQWVDPNTPKPETRPETAKASEMPKGKGADGDTGATGGGGMNQPTPPRLGTPPQMAALPPVMSPIAPSAMNPSLPMNPTIEGPPSPPPPPEATIGSPTGVKDGSGGPGKGEGIGKGDGNGVGDSKGDGAGKNVAGPGNGETPGSPNGSLIPTGPIPWNTLSSRPESSNIRWISRPRPRLTAEAQASRVSGTVLLRATFHANGTITDIEIINGVPGMTDSAIESLKNSRFRPATVMGTPVTVTKVPVRIDIAIE